MKGSKRRGYADLKARRYIGILLLSALAVLFAAVGCMTDDKTKDTLSDLCIFHTRNDGTPVKTMLSSAKTTAVCVDPLCSHGLECPFANAHGMGDLDGLAIDNLYCFVSGSASVDGDTGEHFGECSLCVYDMTDGSLRMLESYPDSIFFLAGYSPYVYYAVADYREEDGNVSYGYSLYRANVESGAVMELPLTRAYSTENHMSTGDFPSVYAFENDRILWYAPGEDGIEFYTTDLAGHDRQQLPIDDPHVMNGAYSDGWAYYTIRNHDLPAPSDGELGRLKFQNENSLYRYSFDTGESKLLADNVAQYIVTEDGIFFTIMEPTPSSFEWNGITYYDLYAGKIYRMTADGSDPTLFCTLDGMDISVYSSVFLGYHGGYLALAYREKIENKWYDSGYDYNTATEIIVVDTRNQTWKISTDET